MNRLLLGSFAFAAGLAIAGTPALAQKTQRYIEVYGDDACPVGSDNEIVVCSRKPESDRYRIPQTLRTPAPGTGPQTSAAQAVRALDVGASGAGFNGKGSCSTSGGNGWTGCWAEQMKQARAEKAAGAAATNDIP